MKIKERNFNSKLHIACSNDVMKGERMQLIHFKNGKAYASNGWIAVRQPLAVHSLFPEDIEALEGKFIHAQDYKKIIQFEIIRCADNGIFCRASSGEVFFPYHKYEGEWLAIDPIFEGHEVENIDAIGFNAKNILLISQAFVCDGNLQFSFNKKNKASIVRTLDGEQEAIIMPVMLRSDLV